MVKKNNSSTKISFAEYAVLALAFIYSIILIFVMINGAFTTSGSIDSHYFLMFTTQTNIFCAIWMLLFSFTIFIRNKKYVQIIKNKSLVNSLMLAITMTFLVVALWLNPIWKGSWIEGTSGSLFYTHMLTMVIMWMIFMLSKFEGKYNWKLNFSALIFPLAYFLFCGLVSWFISGWVAYDFLDPSTFGNTKNCVTWIIYIGVIMVLSGVFYGVGFGIDKLHSCFQKKVE